MAHSRDVAAALAELRRTFAREGIPFAVIGALAMRHHGYVRHTEDIDIVTTPEGLARIHERLIGRGLVARGPGLRKQLRETAHKVDLDVLQSGEHAGAPGSPVRYPPPDAPEYAEKDGIRFATLSALLSFKIASGIWGKRLRDLADAEQLIKANGLGEDYARNLPAPLRDKFLELVRASREEREIE
jgi:hypothetical protein